MGSLTLNPATVEELTGTWNLTDYGTLYHAEAPGLEGLEGTEWQTKLTDVTNAWMDDHPDELPEIAPRQGLTTTIDDAGRIEDSGGIGDMVYWDAYGVQGGDLFEGYLAEPDEPAEAEGRVFAFSDEVEPNDVQRCADDAYVTDEFFLGGSDTDNDTDNDGATMVRVMSVVFDGMYLYRSVFVYQRG